MSKKFITGAAACLLTAATASAGVFFTGPGVKSAKASSRCYHPSELYSQKAVQDGQMLPDQELKAPYYKTNNSIGNVISPTGEDWFYTLELDGDILEQNEYYTNWDFKTFLVKVYDTQLNFVGQASGEIERPEGTLKCQSVNVCLQLTSSFFNNNMNDIEIMITANFNPAPLNGQFRYGAKQRTQAFTLTPEIPAGGSKCIFSAPGYYTAAVNSTNTVNENFVLAFAEETTWDGEDVNTCTYALYKKAGYGTPATKFASFDVDITKVMADGNNEALPFTMTVKGTDIYVATAEYEKPFLKNPTADDPEQTPDNNYIITLYKAAGESYTKVGETKIPVTAAEGDYLYRSFALGNFSGEKDLTFDFGDGDKPCYILTVVDSGTTDDTSAYYAVYDFAGNEIKRFGEGSGSYQFFTDIKGKPVQYGFNMYNSAGEYGTVILEYPSFKEVGFLPHLFEHDGDAWQMISVPDRSVMNGGEFYVAAVMPTGGAAENVPNYIGWFRADGSLDHIDSLFFGPSTAKVITNLVGNTLTPYLYNTNHELEYLSYVYSYRPAPATGTDLELVVSDSKGNKIASRKLPDVNADVFAYVQNAETNPYIALSFREITQGNLGEMTAEFIRLPLNKLEGEGTAESPYIIRTFGDLDQVRNNLTSHFRMANSIDCEGQTFRPIAGEFTGTFDGNGFEIRNLNLTANATGAGFFTTLGKEVTEEETAPDAAIRNVTFTNPVIEYTGSTLGTKEMAIVANKAYNAAMTDVRVINPVYNVSDYRVNFGVLACKATNLTVEGCAVKDADIATSLSGGLAGFIYEARGCNITASSFTGKLAGGDNVGGLVCRAIVAPSAIADCHVNAAISGKSNVGGVIASANRSTVLRTVLEGTLSATQNAGAIMGSLERAEGEEAEDFRVIDNCVVAFESFDAPAGAECVHRIVGYSSIDAGEDYVWVPDPNNPEEDGEYKVMPASHEAHLGNNYVLTAIAPFETPAEGALATEGTTHEGDADEAWYESLGYGFGATATAPWVMKAEVPELYFENSLATSMIFSPAEVRGVEGTTVKASLAISNVDIDNFLCEIGDESVMSFSNMELAEDGSAINFAIDLLKAGNTTVTASCGNVKAVLYVVVDSKSGISDATMAGAVIYDGHAVMAAGRHIELYDLQSRLVASASDTLATEGLAAGVYVVRAIAADGTSAVLKIAVK